LCSAGAEELELDRADAAADLQDGLTVANRNRVDELSLDVVEAAPPVAPR